MTPDGKAGQPCSVFLCRNMKEQAKRFYKSKEWKQCRAAYISFAGGLCERCKARGIIRAGYIVHHRKYIDPETVTDPEILLSFNNLEYLCFDCHNKEHFAPKRRYIVCVDGSVIPTEVSPPSK